MKNDPSLSSSQDVHVYILNYESDDSNVVYFPERPSRSFAKDSRSSNSKDSNILKENNKTDLLKIDKIYSLEIDDDNSFISIEKPKRWKRLFKKPIDHYHEEGKKKKTNILHSKLLLRKYFKYVFRYCFL